MLLLKMPQWMSYRPVGSLLLGSRLSTGCNLERVIKAHWVLHCIIAHQQLATRASEPKLDAVINYIFREIYVF